MNTSEIATIQPRTVLVPGGVWSSTEQALGSAIQCLMVNDQGFRFRRMNLYYNGEEFFLTRQALENSQWVFPSTPCQLRFT